MSGAKVAKKKAAKPKKETIDADVAAELATIWSIPLGAAPYFKQMAAAFEPVISGNPLDREAHDAVSANMKRIALADDAAKHRATVEAVCALASRDDDTSEPANLRIAANIVRHAVEMAMATPVADVARPLRGRRSRHRSERCSGEGRRRIPWSEPSRLAQTPLRWPSYSSRRESQMPGSLFHAKRFRSMPYVGSDRLDHWEIEPDGGDVDTVSLTTWSEMVAFSKSLGVPDDVWPAFLECECAIDVPLAEVEAKQPRLRAILAGLSAAEVSPCPLLARIVAYLAQGEHVFFTN